MLYAGTDLKGWELNETNTGLKGDYSKLTEFNVSLGKLASSGGPLYLPAGIKISDKILRYQLFLDAGGITIERCLIRPVGVGKGMPLVTAGNAIIRDSEIDGSLIPDERIVYSIAYSGHGIIERCNIHHAATGIFINNTGSKISVAQGNFIHNLRWISPAHMDGITVRRSDGKGLIIRNNRSICDSVRGSTGALFIQPYQGFIDNVLIEGNLLEGYGYNLYLEYRGHRYGSNIRVINNRFNAYSGSARTVGVDGGPGWHEWSENYIYKKDASDGRGKAVTLKKRK
ncbi:MAG: hypothetical protein JXN64_12060 [Spirochaetes bacterium]|nr:hypothetical protein [Spirochaetota bacterium]